MFISPITVLQVFGLVEEGVTDLAEFAAGEPVTQTLADGWSNSVIELPNGPVAPYQTFSGSVLNMLLLAATDYGAIQGGMPVSIAEKFGTKWYGETLTPPAPKA